MAYGLLRNFPQVLLEEPPRIAAPTATARAALGYLHANCAHCHNDAGSLASVDLILNQSVATPDSGLVKTLASLVGHWSKFRPHGASPEAKRIVAEHPETSVLVTRIRSRNPYVQMPPIGTRVIDAEGIALLEHWIQHDLQPGKETLP